MALALLFASLRLGFLICEIGCLSQHPHPSQVHQDPTLTASYSVTKHFRRDLAERELELPGSSSQVESVRNSNYCDLNIHLPFGLVFHPLPLALSAPDTPNSVLFLEHAWPYHRAFALAALVAWQALPPTIFHMSPFLPRPSFSSLQMSPSQRGPL